MAKNKVILLGYRGSGKSTVATELSDRLAWQSVDTDDRVRERFGGVSIAEIWAQHGEPRFREVEVEVAREVIEQPQHVIALGGGTVMQVRAREAIQALNPSQVLRVYLYAPAAVLFRRIRGDTQTEAQRPSLTGQTQAGGGLSEIEAVLAERDATYRSVADVVIDVSDASPVEIVEQILQRLNES